MIGWGGRRGVFCMEMEREGGKGREQARHDTTWHGMAWHQLRSGFLDVFDEWVGEECT